MSDDALPLRTLWMSDMPVDEDEMTSAIAQVLEKDRVARAKDRRIRLFGVLAMALLIPSLVWFAAHGVTPLVRGAYALMAIGCAVLLAAEWAYLEWSRQALPGPADARSQLQTTAFMLARQIRLLETAPLWSSPVFIGVGLIALWLYQERTHSAAFALCAVTLTAWIAAGLRAASASAKLNGQRLQMERLLNELQ